MWNMHIKNIYIKFLDFVHMKIFEILILEYAY
jgi:hypothetical protein